MTASDRSRTKRLPRWWFLAIFAVLIAATRLYILLVSDRIFFEYEELVSGMLAQHLDRGLLMPPIKYQFEEYAGGTMITGLLAWPAFQLLGPTYFALKLVPLFFSLIAFAIGFLLIRRFLGGAPSIFFGLVFLFPPPFYLERSLVAFGNHAEMLAFAAAALYLFFASRQPPSGTVGGVIGRRGLLAAFGLVSGFGLYFDYAFAVFLLVLIPFFVSSARSARELGGDVVVILAAMAVGFTPWFFYHRGASAGSFLLDFRGRTAVDSRMATSFNDARLFVESVTSHYVKSFGARELRLCGDIVAGSLALNLTIFAAFATSFALVAGRSRAAAADVVRGLFPSRRKPYVWSAGHTMLPILAFVPVYLAVFGLNPSPFPQRLPPPRYLLPLYLSHLTILAAAMGILWKSRQHRLAGALLALALGGSIAGTAGLLEGETVGESLHRRGYTHIFCHEQLLHEYTFHVDRKGFLDLAQTHFPERVDEYHAGLCAGIGFRYGADVTGHVAAQLAEGPWKAAAFFAGLGGATQIEAWGEVVRPASEIESLVPERFRPVFESGATLGARTDRPPDHKRGAP